MRTEEYHQESFVQIPFLLTSGVWFSLRSLATESLSLAYSSSVRHGLILRTCCLMSSQVCIGYFSNFVPQSSQHIFEAEQIKGQRFVISLVSTFLFLCPAEYHPVPKRLGCRVKAPCRYQLSFSMFNDMCGYCPQHWGLTVSLQRITPCVSNSPGSWGISMGPP